MKNYWIIAFMVLWSFRGSTQPCYPDSDGNYKYYVNLNIAEVSDDFDKADFMALLDNPDALIDEIVKVEKSFKLIKDDFLEHSVSVYAKHQELEHLITSTEFNLVEMVCQPKQENMLLYQPNDYGNITHPSRNKNNAHLELINAKEAWNITKGDSRVLAGVIDTYIETTHDDLVNKIDAVLANSSPNYHGVAVSGCLAGDTDNNLLLSSIGYDTEIVFSSNLYNDNEVVAMAVNPNIRVINLSWINACNSTVTQQTLYNDLLTTHNTVIVAGAGNNPGHCGDNAAVYPAAYSSVISVTAVGHLKDYGYNDPSLGKWNWTDCHEQYIGDNTNGYSTFHHNDKVNICAPGYAVESLTLNNSTAYAWGTSFSSPIVAGVCALVIAVNPCLTAVEVKDIVLGTADASIYQKPENHPYIGLLGTGRVDAYAAVLRALETGTEYIQNQTYNSPNVVTEFGEAAIKAGANVTNTMNFGIVRVNSNADVTFEATHSIVLSEGFIVENNATFKAKIVDSPCW
jgi:subtilisin family serine protease